MTALLYGAPLKPHIKCLRLMFSRSTELKRNQKKKKRLPKIYQHTPINTQTIFMRIYNHGKTAGIFNSINLTIIMRMNESSQ